MKELKINNNIFIPGGVLNRGRYLAYCWAFSVGLTIVVLPLYFLRSPSFYYASIIVPIARILWAYLFLINTFKRIRDVRGTTKDQLLWQITYTLLTSIPIMLGVKVALLLNVLLQSFLFLKKGVVTSEDATPLNELFSGKSHQDNGGVEKLEKLHDLKEKGVLTEEEFAEEKKKILKVG